MFLYFQKIPITWAKPAYIVNVKAPTMVVTVALTNSPVQGPARMNFRSTSKIKGLYDENMSKAVTIGLKLFFKSCRDHNQIKVAVIIFWTREIFDSRHFCIYFQSNSAPRAPTQRSSALERITSAVAQPMPAVKTLL